MEKAIKELKDRIEELGKQLNSIESQGRSIREKAYTVVLKFGVTAPDYDTAMHKGKNHISEIVNAGTQDRYMTIYLEENNG